MPPTKHVHVALRNITPKSVWGCRETFDNSSIICFADNEYVASVGSRMMAFDINANHDKITTLVDPYDNDVLFISSMALSPDGKYLSTLVKMKEGPESRNNVTFLIYNLEDRFHGHTRPRVLHFNDSSAGHPHHLRHIKRHDSAHPVEITCMAFSHDSYFFACGSNVKSAGLIIFDHFRGTVYQKISIESTVRHITFNPENNLKICTTGDSGLFKFWRFSEKAVHAAPVNGLKVGDFSYTCHAWIDDSGVLIAGSNKGFVIVVQGCEQITPLQYAFGNPSMADDSTVNENTITNILIRGDIACVVSITNAFAVYEIRRGVATEKDAVAPFSSIVLLTRIRLPNVDFILGIQWCLRDSTTSYNMMAMSPSAIFQFELITETEIAVFSAGSSSNKGPESIPITPNVHGRSIAASMWLEITGEKSLFKYHSSAINAISLSTRNHSVITSSFEDATVRVWDYNDLSNFNSSYLIETYKGPMADDNPFHLDMHPSGLYVAFACENEVKEFAVTDSALDLMKKTSTKTSFVGPTGIPFNITQPVSLVKYSNGGQYLAVVTGKVAQVFHCYSKTFATGSVTGESSRIMILCDHIAPITDLAFLKDDTQIVTSASDGSVYSWKVGAVTRDSEFVFKGVPATLVAVSKYSGSGNAKECTIVACFENNFEISSIAATAVFKKKESGKFLRKITRASFTNENGGEDVAEMMNNHFNSFNNGSTKYSSGEFGNYRRSSIYAEKTSPDMAAAMLDSAVVGDSSGSRVNKSFRGFGSTFANNTGATMNGINKPQKGQFLAVWTNGKVTSTPHIIHLQVPVCSIAMGETDGPDRVPLCVLGLEDGRILISELPFPVRSLDGSGSGLGMSPLAQPAVGHQLEGTNIAAASLLVTNTTKRSVRNKEKSSTANISFMSSQESTASSVASESTRSSNTSAPPPIGYSPHGTAPHSHKYSPTRNSISQSHMLAILENEADEVMMHNKNRVSSPLQGGLLQNSTASGGATVLTTSSVDQLDETLCREFRMHVGAVMQVAITIDGMWLFSAGSDGVMYMFACSRRSKELTEVPQSSDVAEDRFLMIDRSKIQSIRNTLKEAELAIEILKKDNELSLAKVTGSKNKIISDLEDTMKKEIKKRDETIIQGRSEYISLKNQKKEELESMQKHCMDTIAEIEVQYERKLTQESLYLEKMRQAYDEYVVHSRLDLQDVQLKTDKKIQDIELEKAAALKEAEKQKSTLLQYFDFIRLRNNEILVGLEDKQESERHRLKEELKTANKALEDIYNQNLTDQAKFNRKTQNLQMEIENKDLEVLKQKNDILWANDRISKLETALQKATHDLKLKEEMSEKWESKTGELQQKIIDLERIRKALTTQLHTLRQELGPKEENLVKVSEKLQEMDREYELSLNAISEKDSALTQKSMNLHLLQKQIRELRNAAGRKDAIIRRAATIFEDYRVARQQAYFSSEKRTIVGTASTTNNSNNNNTAASAVIQEIDEHGQVIKEKTINKDNNRGGSRKPTPATATAAHTLSNNKSNLNNSHQKSNSSVFEPTSGVIEIVAQNEEMKNAFKRLSDMLSPYLKEDHADTEIQDDIEAVRSEQERHMKQLHNTVSRVRSSLDLVNVVSEKKIYNYLNDNKTLLLEVNNLRTEVRNLSMENQRLMAQMEFSASVRGSKKSSRQQEVVSDEDFLSVDDSLSSCSDEMVVEKTRAQLIREKSTRSKKRKSGSNSSNNRQSSLSSSMPVASTTSSKNSRESRRSNAITPTTNVMTRDSTGDTLSAIPGMATAMAASPIAWTGLSMGSGQSPTAAVPRPVSLTVIPSTKVPPRREQDLFLESAGDVGLSSANPFPSGGSDTSATPVRQIFSVSEVSKQQQMKDHMKKYTNFGKEKDKKMTADEKIAAIIALNEKDIKALHSTVPPKPAIADGRKTSTNISTTNNKGKSLGTAFIELPSVFGKK